MPKIEYTIDKKTGNLTVHTKGIKGKSCTKIHDAVAQDMATLGVQQTESRDTPEMLERETVQQTNRLQLRS